MSKKVRRSTPTVPDRTAFGEFEDAHRAATEAAAMLIAFFEAQATATADPDLAPHPHAMTAAHGYRNLAGSIIEQLDVMHRAADALQRQGGAR